MSPRRCQLQRQTSKKCNPLLRDTAHPGAASQHQQATVQLQKPHGAVFSQQDWNAEASPLLSSLGIATNTSPQQLWQHLSANSSTQEQQQQLQQQLQQHLDLPSCRLLLRAAAATCSTQQQYNQLRPLIQAATAVFPAFELGDFQLLLQLCAQARYVPDKEWLAAAIYADTGGFERLYQQVGWLKLFGQHMHALPQYGTCSASSYTYKFWFRVAVCLNRIYSCPDDADLQLVCP